MSDRPRPAGLSLALYGGGFVLVVAAAALLGAAVLDELQETTMLWISAGASCGAAILALLALFLPRRAAG